MAAIIRNARLAGLLGGAVFAAVVASSLLAIVTIVGGKDAAIEDATELNRSLSLAAAHAQKIAGDRGYVLVHDGALYQDYEAAHRATHRLLRELREHDRAAELEAMIARVERAEAAYDEAFATSLATANGSVTERADLWNATVRPKAHVVDQAIAELITREGQRARSSAHHAERHETIVVALLLVVVIGVLLLGGLVSVTLGRSAARGLSAEQRARKEAEQAHGFLAALLDQLPLGVIVAEAPSGRIMHVSATAQALLAHPIPSQTESVDGYAEWIERQPHREDGTTYAADELPLARAVRGELVRAEMTWSPNGKVFESHAAPVRDSDGALVAAVVAFSEVTERQRAEAERERFLDVLGHDLRNPIYAITLSTGFLIEQSTGMPERARRAAARIQSSAERMRRLIEQLLDFARSRSGKMRLEVRSLDLADLVRETVADVELGCPACDIRVVCDGPVAGRWDHDRLSQVLHNLIGNAVQHSTAGTPVEVEVWRDGGSCVVSVSNRGDSIPTEMLDKIFEPFRRGSRSRGLGLGLFIAHQIVEAHGGSITVTSADGATTFTARLPCQARGLGASTAVA